MILTYRVSSHASAGTWKCSTPSVGTSFSRGGTLWEVSRDDSSPEDTTFTGVGSDSLSAGRSHHPFLYRLMVSQCNPIKLLILRSDKFHKKRVNKNSFFTIFILFAMSRFASLWSEKSTIPLDYIWYTVMCPLTILLNNWNYRKTVRETQGNRPKFINWQKL
jgi:hypothetical protein